MDENKDISFGKLLPYLGSFIIFLGITRLIFYYECFGVHITSYLEFSEIITSFLDIIVIVVTLFIFHALKDFLIKSKTEHEKKIC